MINDLADHVLARNKRVHYAVFRCQKLSSLVALDRVVACNNCLLCCLVLFTTTDIALTVIHGAYKHPRKEHLSVIFPTSEVHKFASITCPFLSICLSVYLKKHSLFQQVINIWLWNFGDVLNVKFI